MDDQLKKRPTSRECLDDPEAFRIADWRLHNRGDDTTKPEVEIDRAKKHGPGLMRAAKNAFNHIDSGTQEHKKSGKGKS
jgi:hypothetical protein